MVYTQRGSVAKTFLRLVSLVFKKMVNERNWAALFSISERNLISRSISVKVSLPYYININGIIK